MKLICSVLFAMLVPVTGGRTVSDVQFEATLERAREAAIDHRYGEVIELLTPFNAAVDPETRYITASEIGRAFFHLGRYQEAHRAFREAVRLHPERAESAIYLQATSYLVGESAQAYAILREILSSGATDLYLALTLPGERRFAADPEVQAIIEEHVVPIDLDLERGNILGVSLGDSRTLVVENLQVRSSDPEAAVLTASAGPALIWAFVFDAEQKLDEIFLQAENLLRYTPYRLRLDPGVDWRANPAKAVAAWGTPSHTETSYDDGIMMSWERSGLALNLEFGRPRKPRPFGIAEGAAMLRTVRLKRQNQASAGRMIE